MTLFDLQIIKAHGHRGPTAIQREYLPHRSFYVVRYSWRKLGCVYQRPEARYVRPVWGTWPSDRRKRKSHPKAALYCRRYREKLKAQAEMMSSRDNPLLRVAA